ncbi:MAG TPA: N-glycosylase/DNA lyase [archaeon]|nr:N-glycosylase/DNA lyase [archaeon]
MTELNQKYLEKRGAIEKRLQEFRDIYAEPDDVIFEELCFCLLTPQTKAKSAAKVIEKLKEKNLLLTGSAEEIKKWMAAIRFNNNKANYIIGARELLMENGNLEIKKHIEDAPDVFAVRNWLVKNIKGYGMKEASHFLRNIGFGDDIAILDRHILKNMVKYGVIPEVPSSLTEKKYLELEKKLIEFSKNNGIPPAHLDLVWWSEETGEIFK